MISTFKAIDTDGASALTGLARMSETSDRQFARLPRTPVYCGALSSLTRVVNDENRIWTANKPVGLYRKLILERLAVPDTL